MKQANVIVTSISIPRDLAPKIAKRVKQLKKRHQCNSASDYYVKLAHRDIESATKVPPVATPKL